jgi:transposase
MPLRPSLEERREHILEQIRNIRTMRRGTINEQYLKVPRKDKEPLLRGPYYVLSWNEDGKTRSLRLKPEDLDQTRQDIAAYKNFQKLAKEFVEVTETMTQELHAETEDLKKTPSP